MATLTAEKQGPFLYLSLKSKARKAALELDIDNIKGENGVQLILERLDALYLEGNIPTVILHIKLLKYFKDLKI